MSECRIAVLASGRGSNFEALVRGDTGQGRIVLLLTDNPDAPVLDRASELGVRFMYLDPGKYRTRFGIPEEEKWVSFLRDEGIELVCLAGLMRLLKGPLLKAYANRIMNIHPALLPSFPGLESQKRALEYGVRFSGCTVHYVDEGTDTGPIIIQAAVPVLDGDTIETLSRRILCEEHRIYPEAVRLHSAGCLTIDGRIVRIGPG
jgi:phosphoribosylglycinamide formyltransferase-1